MLAAAALFALGILLRHFWRPPSLLVLATALLAVCGLLASRLAPRIALSAAALVWLTLGWTCAVLRPPLLPDAPVLQYADGLRRAVTGTVAAVEPTHATARRDEDPLHWDEARLDAVDDTATSKTAAVDISLKAIEQVTPDTSTMAPITGGVRLTLPATAATALHCGDQVTLNTRLRPPPSYRDPGVWQYPQYLAADGISATGSATQVIASQPGNAPLPCRVTAVRHWAADRLQHFATWQRHLRLPAALRWSPDDTGLLNAMLFGDRSALQGTLRVQFERTGAFHLFVVAGMHVGLVAGGAYWLLTALRLRRSAALLLSFAAACAYALLTGFGDPVQRALWMTGAYLLAQLLARDRNPLNALGIAGLLLLVARPQTLFDSAFQMTILVVLAIAGIAVPLLQRTLQPYVHACRHLNTLRFDAHLQPRLAQFRVGLRFTGELLAGVLGHWSARLPAAAAWLVLATLELSVLFLVTEMVMALPMALYFHRITVVALPANLLVVPAVPLLLAAAVTTFIASLASPWLALLPALLVAALLRWTALVIGGFGHLRAADLRIGNPPMPAIDAALLLTAASLFFIRRRSVPTAWVAVAALPVLVSLLIAPWPARLHPGALEVTAIDVGQGDSLFLAGPDGATMLIDAGGQVGAESTVGTATFDTGESVVSPYLWSRGLRHIDVLALTHAHMDHIGGMLATLRNFSPRELWLSVDADSPTLRELLAEAAARRITVRHLHTGDQLPWSSGTVSVLSPGKNRSSGEEATNDDSLVLRTGFGQSSVLLEGDAEHPSEDGMLAAHLLGPVTLLKVGHHGSMTSTGEAFLSAVHPQTAVISCGRGNRFGHPRMPVLQRLQAVGVQTARTDTMGLAQYLLHADGTWSVHFPGVDTQEDR